MAFWRSHGGIIAATSVQNGRDISSFERRYWAKIRIKRVQSRKFSDCIFEFKINMRSFPIILADFKMVHKTVSVSF